MLLELTVRNFAVIEETRLTLGPGFSVITGETGAGKSLLVDALEMVLGGRADRDLIRAGATSASVEAVFQLPSGHAAWQEAQESQGLPVEEDGVLVLAREVHREGRSLSRINGRTAPLSAVKAVSQHLVDIHGQGEHLSLLNSAFQLRLLDLHGGLESARAAVAEGVTRLRRWEQELAALTADTRQEDQRRDLLEFQVSEIDAARLQPGEDEVLLQEQGLLANARALQEACAVAREALYSGTPSATELIASARQALSRTADPTGALAQHLAMLESAAAQVEEAAREIRTYGDAIEDDPARLEQVEERLDLLRKLQQKYGDTIDAVLAYADEARRELEGREQGQQRREVLERELAEAYTKLGAQAWELSLRRQEAASSLEQAVSAELAHLDLGGVNFVVSLSRRATEQDGLPSPQGDQYGFTETGIDQMEFQVATNPGEGLKPLVRVASGGETSRLMLAIKTALRANDHVSTLVFDEIDSGVGGRGGEVVGRKLWTLGRHRQVLCVTHLPQIAACADHHFRVDKEVLLGRTYAQVLALEGEARVRELTDMLGVPSGSRPDGVARQMLARARADKGRASP